MTEKKQAINAPRAGGTFRMNPDDIQIPPPGHFLHDPTSPTKASPRLVKMIKAVGFFGVITVTKLDDVVYVLLGRDRLLAVREVNEERVAASEEPLLIEAQYRPLTDPTMAVRMIRAENKVRRKVSQVDDARYAAMLAAQGLSKEMIMEELEVSEGTVRNMLQLGAQPDFVHAAVAAREISVGDAKRLEGTDAEKRAALKAAKEKGGAGAGKGRKKNLRPLFEKGRQMGINLNAKTWKALLDTWKAL